MHTVFCRCRRVYFLANFLVIFVIEFGNMIHKVLEPQVPSVTKTVWALGESGTDHQHHVWLGQLRLDGFPELPNSDGPRYKLPGASLIEILGSHESGP